MAHPLLRTVPMVLAVVLGCRASSERPDVARATEPAHVISADFKEGRLIARDTVTAGWTTLQIRAGGGSGHNLVAYRVDDSVVIEAFLAALDTAIGPIANAVSLGGPEEEKPDVTILLAPGRIVLVCMMRDDQRRRHGAHGESRVIHVVPPVAAADTGAAPLPTLTISMTDFAYPGADTWPAGAHTIAVTNDGTQDHLVVFRRLRPGRTMRDLVESDGGDEVSTYLGGLARTGPGRSAALQLDLTPGDYVLSCLVTDPRTHSQHVELGMLKLVHVVAR